MTSSANTNPMPEAPSALTRRRLILRDTLTFISLSVLTLALFAATLFLFRSFTTHREELGQRWSARGAVDLQQNKPEQAADALRTALSYNPGERSYELLLAQALAESGHTDEAFNYFTGLWDTQPGNGFINLQLARLARKRRDVPQATNFYRASIYGTWEGDGTVRRREVRLELAQYLLQNHKLPEARAELMVAEGNDDKDAVLDLRIAHMFEQGGDQNNALDALLKATEATPKDPTPYAQAGQLAFSMGQFPLARRLLASALHLAGPHPTTFDRTAVSSLLERTTRLMDLVPGQQLPAEQRVDRILEMRDVVQGRLRTCNATLTPPNPNLQDLAKQWSTRTRMDRRWSLLRTPANQDILLQLIYSTELETDKVCGPATGDDAVILMLARDPALAGTL